MLEIHELCEHTNVCVGGCISKEEIGKIVQLQGDHKSSAQQKQMIVYNEHKNSEQTFGNKNPDMGLGCQFQFSVIYHITKELLFKNKKG